MKKITNIRPIFISAVAMLIACAFAVSVAKSEKAKLIIALVFFVAFIIFAVLRATTKIKVFSIFACALLFAALPFLNLYFRSLKAENYQVFNGKQISVSGRIFDTRLYSENSFYVVLDGVSVTDKDTTKSVDGRVAFYVSARNLDLSKFEVGRVVEVSGKFTFYSLSGGDSKAANHLSKNIVATGSVNFYNIKFSDEIRLSLRDKIKAGVHDKLNKFGGDFADIGYGMLFGDSYEVDSEILDTFRTTGIAHILAVSGLHVSVIVMAISFILKKLKTPKWLQIILLGCLLGFYCYLCDFSVSVLRASLLAVFLFSVRFTGRSYDRLTALSFVAILILLVNPLELYNVSYVLSFSAVLSIILLMLPLFRFFNKFMYKWLANPLALITAVQIGLLVTTVFFFGKFNVLGILTNFVSIPIASLAFTYLIFACLLSFIIPPISAMLGLFSVLMRVVVKFNFWIAGLGLVINFENVKWLAVIASLVVMYTVSDYVFVKKSTKAITSVIIILVCTFCSLLFLI